LGVTIGDPAGIGPEILVMAWRQREALPTFQVFGPRGVFDAWPIEERPPLVETTHAISISPGCPTPEGARAAFDALEAGVAAALAGKCAALVTAPIAKSWMYQVGFHWPGHTEFLADRCNVPDHATAMMLAGPDLRTVPMTVHVPMKDVPQKLTAVLVRHQALVTGAALKNDFAIPNPRLVVAGLNPHAGENGSLGREDVDVLTPVIAELAAAGLNIRGPISADSLFHAAARKTYDAALCAYHDQALIPVKTLAFDETVNVTLGLPIVRTSPDHGTAFDIAGRGVANPASLIAALKLARRCADARG
jgi:4-hydroxythreonine-4-phosphate dehydrogenase